MRIEKGTKVKYKRKYNSKWFYGKVDRIISYKNVDPILEDLGQKTGVPSCIAVWDADDHSWRTSTNFKPILEKTWFQKYTPLSDWIKKAGI